MKIDVNANSLRRLIRLMRTLADELENVCDKNKATKSKGFVSALMAVPDDESDILEIIEHYKKILRIMGENPELSLAQAAVKSGVYSPARGKKWKVQWETFKDTLFNPSKHSSSMTEPVELSYFLLIL